jgi:hypothetical protein
MTRVSSNAPRRLSRLLPVAGALSGLALAAAPAASSEAAVLDTSACNDAPLSQPFAAWGDLDSYALVPGGDFEGSLSGWTLSGGAGTLTGSEPYAATGTLGNYSMDLPAGASVTSPPVCVDAAYPYFRFFAINDSANAKVIADVLFAGPKGNLVDLPVGKVTGDNTWQPSDAMHTAGLIASVLAGGATNIQLRFTALAGESQIDDVYLDPRLTH